MQCHQIRNDIIKVQKNLRTDYPSARCFAVAYIKGHLSAGTREAKILHHIFWEFYTYSESDDFPF